MQTRLDKFGRVLIPKAMRQKLGITPGQMIHLEESSDEIIIRARLKTRRSIGADKGKIKIADDFDAPLHEFKDYMP